MVFARLDASRALLRHVLLPDYHNAFLAGLRLKLGRNGDARHAYQILTAKHQRQALALPTGHVCFLQQILERARGPLRLWPQALAAEFQVLAGIPGHAVGYRRRVSYARLRSGRSGA